jgi:hypothetical protein
MEESVNYNTNPLLIYNEGWDLGEITPDTIIFSNDITDFLERIGISYKIGFEMDQTFYSPEIVVRIPLPNELFKRAQIGPRCLMDDKQRADSMMNYYMDDFPILE